MANSQRRANDHKDGYFGTCFGIFGQGGSIFQKERLVILSLGLLNVVLLIIAVVIGVSCVKVKESSFHVSHPTAKQLLNELDYLRSNHSDVIEAEEEAKNQFEDAVKKHEQLKTQIEQQRTINDDFQKQIETMQTEQTNLKSNVSALEGSCGKCLTGWSLFNSSCYFFSSTESSTVKKRWADGRADCVSRGADLVVIDNEDEQEFVSNSIEAYRGPRSVWANGFWIGLIAEESWVWINNVTEVEHRYWMSGQPNKNGDWRDDCGVAAFSPSNPWKTRYDANCENNKYWICEMRLD